MRVYLLRHGESRSNAAAGVVSLPEAEGDRLSELGRRQAGTAAKRIAADFDIERIVSSPMRRARETAAPLAEATRLEPEVWDWLGELREVRGYGELSGQEQQRQRWSNRMLAQADDPHHAPEGADSFAGLLARVERMRERLVADGVDRTLVVGHGIFFRFTFALTLLGESFHPAMVDRLWRLGSLNCGLCTFDHLHREGTDDPSDVAGWRCVSWMAPTVGRADVTGTGGGGAGS